MRTSGWVGRPDVRRRRKRRDTGVRTQGPGRLGWRAGRRAQRPLRLAGRPVGAEQPSLAHHGPGLVPAADRLLAPASGGHRADDGHGPHLRAVSARHRRPRHGDCAALQELQRQRRPRRPLHQSGRGDDVDHPPDVGRQRHRQRETCFAPWPASRGGGRDGPRRSDRRGPRPCLRRRLQDFALGGPALAVPVSDVSARGRADLEPSAFVRNPLDDSRHERPKGWAGDLPVHRPARRLPQAGDSSRARAGRLLRNLPDPDSAAVALQRPRSAPHRGHRTGADRPFREHGEPAPYRLDHPRGWHRPGPSAGLDPDPGAPPLCEHHGGRAAPRQRCLPAALLEQHERHGRACAGGEIGGLTRPARPILGHLPRLRELQPGCPDPADHALRSRLWPRAGQRGGTAQPDQGGPVHSLHPAQSNPLYLAADRPPGRPGLLVLHRRRGRQRVPVGQSPRP